MRAVIHYTKEEEIKYISHLDLLRLVQRIMRRADVPSSYSQGFNPHPRLAFASALAVGITSEGEYLDVFLDKAQDLKELCQRMNEKSPKGIKFQGGLELDPKTPSLMSLIERAKYLIKIPDIIKGNIDLEDLVKRFLEEKEVWVLKTNRKGSSYIDIRDMIHDLHICNNKDDNTYLQGFISTGSKANLKPDLLLDALFGFGKIKVPTDTILQIHRLNLYLLKGTDWVTPMEIE